MRIGNTQILSKVVAEGNNEINFTEEQLDTIYKLYGKAKSLIVNFILTTTNKYENSRACVITLKRKSKDDKN